jgi:hypothetical protein
MKTNITKPFGFMILTCMISLGIIVGGCSKEDGLSDDYLDESIVNSVALEEFIVAGFDYQHSLAVFESEVRNIDFSKLETSVDSKGNMVVNIPTSVSIEEKAEILNMKKQVLIETHPQFISMELTLKQKYLQSSIKQSLNVNSKLLEIGINYNLPKLKAGTVESFDNSEEYCSYLASWVTGSNYVETFLVVFTDGSAITFTDNRNTSSTCYSPGFSQSNNGQWSVNGYPNRTVAYVAHTHIYSDNPSGSDLSFRDNHPGLTVAIYYSGTMSFY